MLAGRRSGSRRRTGICQLSVDPKQTFVVMGNVFFNSAEYVAQNRDNTGFVTDLYITFFGRLPDAAGLNFWLAQMTAGLPRNGVLSAFLFSPEFTATMNGVFPGRTARAETYLVMNLYGGFFRRLADSAGYTFWDGQLRLAQCSGNPQAGVQATVNSISQGFLLSPEYVALGNSNSQYIQDLYYAMLQRGGDQPGSSFWVGQLATTSRDAIRRAVPDQSGDAGGHRGDRGAGVPAVGGHVPSKRNPGAGSTPAPSFVACPPFIGRSRL